jgi:omega-amidase
VKIIHLSLVQFDPVWENSLQNIDFLNSFLQNISQKTDLLILPEMFLTGFSMNVEKVIQTMDGEGVTWMKKVAIEKKLTIIGSLAIHDRQKNYNRLLSINPEGEVSWYDKRHLFRMGEENSFYHSGNEKILINVNDWKILPLVCYDLRFPVWSRNVNCQYDLLVYVTNWPESRRDAYRTLLKARAIENLCYVVGVNRIGKDGNGVNYFGDSVVIGPKGNILTDYPNYETSLIDISLDLEELLSFRQKFPAHLDADQFIIQ